MIGACCTRGAGAIRAGAHVRRTRDPAQVVPGVTRRALGAVARACRSRRRRSVAARASVRRTRDPAQVVPGVAQCTLGAVARACRPVSYTHLTLPTIYSV